LGRSIAFAQLIDHHGEMGEQTCEQTIPAFLAATVARRADEPALGCIRDGDLHWRTWREVADEAQRSAASIQARGIEPGDRVAHVSENRYEWIITDLALHLAGAVHVPIHVTLSGQQMAEQIADCGARLVFVSSRQLLDEKLSGGLESNLAVLVHDEIEESAGASLASSPRPQPPAPDDLATILYTSGTTGRPRGVMLSQRNLAANAAAIVEAYGGGPDETRLNVLPLSHIYARTCDLYTWVYRGSRLVLGESRDTIARDLALVRPTTMSAVPYVYERIADSLKASGVANESSLRDFFGGRMKRLTCGGAPLSPHIDSWYAERGLPIHCGYGLTEASPVVTVSTRDSYQAGSVGRPLPNVEVRLADDGEILVRGPSIMTGYWKDSEATAQAIRGGWLHTGDRGEVDNDGFLTIVGRNSETIVLSTGKKVSPCCIESLLTGSPLIEQAAVFGEGQGALVALIAPSIESEERGTRYEEFGIEIKRCLADASHEEQVRRFAILNRQFSVERGELTAKRSLCRAQIAANFAAELAVLAEDRVAEPRPDGPTPKDKLAQMTPLNTSQSRR
jgi:long-chain acyl-CoA synthetase